MKDALEYTNIYTHTCVLKKKYIHTHKYLYIYNRRKKTKIFENGNGCIIREVVTN